MTRSDLENYIRETYPCRQEQPWTAYPDYTVFRHPGNRKCFAFVMDVPRDRFGLPGEGLLSVVNLKCGPILAASLRAEPGFFPAYHMNKEHWISAALDGSAPEDRLKFLLDISYDATAPKRRKPKND